MVIEVWYFEFLFRRFGWTFYLHPPDGRWSIVERAAFLRNVGEKITNKESSHEEQPFWAWNIKTLSQKAKKNSKD